MKKPLIAVAVILFTVLIASRAMAQSTAAILEIVGMGDLSYDQD
jgi:hypothetical protein